MDILKLLLGTGILFSQINLLNPLISGASQPYTPPRDRDRQQDTEAYGSRGCSQDAPRLTLLIPQQQKSSTLTGHPSFLFYLDKAPLHPIIVSITEPKVAEPIFYRELSIARLGIVRVNVPSNTPELQPGKQYVLTVALICNPQRSSERKLRRVAFERVEPDSALQRQLAQATNDYEKAQILAQAEIGYDAIAMAYQAYFEQLSVRETALNFQQFLHQLGI